MSLSEGPSYTERLLELVEKLRGALVSSTVIAEKPDEVGEIPTVFAIESKPWDGL